MNAAYAAAVKARPSGIASGGAERSRIHRIGMLRSAHVGRSSDEMTRSTIQDVSTSGEDERDTRGSKAANASAIAKCSGSCIFDGR